MVTYDPTTSPQVTVTVTEKAGMATLTLTGPATIIEEQDWNYSGRLTGLGGVGIAGAWIDVMTSPDGVNWTTLMTRTTASDGAYSGSIAFMNPGTFQVKAYWSGGSIPG